MKPDEKNNPVKPEDWRNKGFDSKLNRITKSPLIQPGYIAGVNFDATLDEMLFNRMLKLKDLRIAPQGNDPGKIYWDGTNKKYKLWVDANSQWVDLVWTSTSTTSSSSSSSSTSSTSSSSSTSSTSSSTSTT